MPSVDELFPKTSGEHGNVAKNDGKIVKDNLDIFKSVINRGQDGQMTRRSKESRS